MNARKKRKKQIHIQGSLSKLLSSMPSMQDHAGIRPRKAGNKKERRLKMLIK
jgi:hypothetical protein